ncbi:MAG: hypothetical protein RLZZ303_2880 [Candidatus Hydrogenedentota bacterium]|jgi:uncharacterized GH25 family protein
MRSLLSISFILMTALAGHAHFMWLELPEETLGEVHLRFTEEPQEKRRQSMQEKAQPMQVRLPGGESIVMEPGEEALVGKVTTDTALVVGSLDYGVLDKTAEGRGKFLLVYHAKGVRSAADAAKPAGLPVELMAKRNGNSLLVTVLKDGQPAAATEIVATVPGSEEALNAVTDENGQATLKFNGEGWIGVRAMVAEQTPGEHNGEAYELTRAYTSLAIKVNAE